MEIVPKIVQFDLEMLYEALSIGGVTFKRFDIQFHGFF